MKTGRQQKILELVEKYDIDTQDTLMRKLSEVGYQVTQTTVSRDIRQLHLVKGTTGRGTYKYTIAAMRQEQQKPVLHSPITDAVLKMQAAGNLIIVKTLAGMANAVAVCIDALEYREIVGSVAGDDTILIVVTDDETAVTMVDSMKEALHLDL